MYKSVERSSVKPNFTSKFRVPVETFPIETVTVYDSNLKIGACATDFLGFARPDADYKFNRNAKYEQISMYHGRSLEERLDTLNYFNDDYGNPFGALSYKGCVAGTIRTEPPLSVNYRNSSFEVIGMVDDVETDRLLRTSDLLRRFGIPTEMILKVSRLKELIDSSGNYMTVDEWREREIKEARNSKMRREYISNVNLFVVKRATQLGLRMIDTNRLFRGSPEKWNRLISSVFDWINLVSIKKGYGVTPGTPPVEFRVNDKDIRRYLFDWMPTQLGISTARVHSMGIVFRYPHSQNWTAAGTFCDLDSLEGKLTNGSTPSSRKYHEDIYTILNGFYGSAKGYVNRERLTEVDEENYYQIARRNFKFAYESEYQNLYNNEKTVLPQIAKI